MVDYPNNAPAGVSFTDDPQLTSLAGSSLPRGVNYAQGLAAQAAMAQGGSGGSTAAPAAPAASAGSPAPAAASSGTYQPPARIDLGYRAPEAKGAADSAARMSDVGKVFAGEVPFHALPPSWQGRLHEAFGPTAPAHYDAFRAKVAAVSPQAQMERDFGNIAAGRGRSALPDRDYRTTAGQEASGPPSGTIMQPRGPSGTILQPGQPDAVGGTISPPQSTVTMNPHQPVGFEGNPAFQPSNTGAISPSEVTATDAFGGAQANGPGTAGGPPGGAPPAPGAAGGPPDPRLRPGDAEQPPGPGSSITVKPGDNLWTIARDTLGDPRKAKEIAQLNNIRHPSMIHPGLVLRLPGGMDPANVATPIMRPGAPTTAGPPQPAPPQPAPPPPAPPAQPPPADFSGGGGGNIGQMGQGDELDDLTQAAAVRAHEMLSGDTSDHLDEYPFHPGGGDVGAPPPVRPSPAASSEPLTHTGGPGTGRYAAPPAAVIREPGYQRSLEMQPAVDRAAQERARGLEPYRDPGALGTDPARMERMRQELRAGGKHADYSGPLKLAGMGDILKSHPYPRSPGWRDPMLDMQQQFEDTTIPGEFPHGRPPEILLRPETPNFYRDRQLNRGYGDQPDLHLSRQAALSANDNGLPGVPAMTNPGRPLPRALQPNIMPDYLRGQRPLPVGRPANQAALSEILQARQHRFGLPESIRRQLELEGYA